MPDDPKPQSPPELLAGMIGESGVQYSGPTRRSTSNWGIQVLEEWDKDLRGQRAAKMYREMRDNEGPLNAAISAMIMFSARTRWLVKPADQTPAAAETAAFVQSCMADLGTPGKVLRPSWRDTLVGILSCIQYGFSVSEVTFKVRDGVKSVHKDGRYGWNKIQNLGQQSIVGWLFDEEGDVIGVEQEPPNTGGILRITGARRLLLVRAPGAHNPGNPEGRSMLRSCVVAYLRKKGLQNIQAMGAQRNLVGLPTFNIPLDYLSPAAPAAQQALVSKLKQLGENLDADRLRFLLFPAEETADGKKTGFKFSLQSGGQQRPMDLEPTIQRYAREIVAAVLADWLLLGSGAGSYALSSDKTGMWVAYLEGLLDIVAEAINRQLLPHLMTVNRIPPEQWPTITHTGVSQEDRLALLRVVGELARAGAITHDTETEQAIRDRAGLPPKTDDAATPKKDGGEI